MAELTFHQFFQDDPATFLTPALVAAEQNPAGANGPGFEPSGSHDVVHDLPIAGPMGTAGGPKTVNLTHSLGDPLGQVDGHGTR